MTTDIRGAKGGGSTHTPTESPDNLRSIAYFRILDLVSEGEIGGLVNGQQSIYLDETPMANPDGSLNFPKAHIEQRTGTPDQTVIPGFDSTENEIGIGVELKAVTPWVRSITNPALDAIRVTLGVPALSKANTTNGDITGYTISYKIELQTDGGAYQQVYSGSFTGKTTTKFQRSHRIDLPTATTGWQVRVTRLTSNANSSAIQDTTTIDSYTEIVDSALAYPDSALMGVMGDASQFTNIPQRAYDLWGRIIQVPSNYDVTDRSYTGVWDGTFKPSWSDNPAWVFYDLCTNTRYGLGHLVSPAQVDKWELYRIGQYCDGMVDDGHGGTEPRFACNVYLQTQADAYKLLNDLSSAFRGISYWANGTIVASADMPGDPVYPYTNANVIDGKFSYSASARKTRYTSALVSWNDPRNFYRTKIEYVEDAEGIARYGFQQATATAFGCTSQGQAQRFGKWLLLTSRMETDTVTFSVGLEGSVAAPGQIITVADAARAGKRQGGRVHSATTTAVTVDAAPTVAVGDTLIVVMPDGVSQTRTVSAVSGTTITVSSAFTSAPLAQSVWTVESTTLAAQTYRVLAVTENKSDENISFTITALQHNASKFSAVDSGTVVVVPPISVFAPKAQAAPTSVTLSEQPVIVQSMASILLTVSWTAVDGATSYDVEWRKDDGQWTSFGNVQGLSADVGNVIAGDYIARVRARSVGGDASVWTYSGGGTPSTIVGKVGALESPTLSATGQLFAMQLNWTFSATQNQTDNAYTEIVYNTANNLEAAQPFGQFAYPLNVAVIDGLLKSTAYWAWARVVDKSGNTSNWAAATATTLSTDDLFQPLQDQITSTQGDVDATIAQVQVLQGQVGDILQADAWAIGDTYPLGDLVQYSGKLYRSLQAGNVGHEPAGVTDAWWEYIGNYASLGEAVGANAANVATLQNTVTQQGNTITANSQSIAQNAAAIENKADASALSTTNATVTQQGNQITAIAADITLLGAHNADKTAFNLNSNTVKIDGSQTLAQTISGLQASDTALGARVDSEQTARANGDAANASAITAVKASSTPNPNLLYNPTAANGWQNWTPGGAWAYTSGVNGEGTYFYQTGVNTGQTVAARQPTAGNVQYTLSADFCTLGLTAGFLHVHVAFYDSTGAYITDDGPSVSFGNYWIRSSKTIVSPANAVTMAVFFYVGYGASGSGNVDVKRIKLESGSNATSFSDDSTVGATASATQSLNASVNSLTGKVDATYTLQLNANGYVSGIVAQNNGTVSNLTIVADNFEIMPSTGTGLRTEFSAGNWRVYDGAGTLRMRWGVA